MDHSRRDSSTIRVRITNNADTTVKDISDGNFKITGSFTLTAPNGTENWTVGNAYNITWTKTGSVANAKLEYSTNGGSTYPNLIIASTPAGGLELFLDGARCDIRSSQGKDLR